MTLEDQCVQTRTRQWWSSFGRVMRRPKQGTFLYMCFGPTKNINLGVTFLDKWSFFTMFPSWSLTWLWISSPMIQTQKSRDSALEIHGFPAKSATNYTSVLDLSSNRAFLTKDQTDTQCLRTNAVFLKWKTKISYNCDHIVWKNYIRDSFWCFLNSRGSRISRRGAPTS